MKNKIYYFIISIFLILIVIGLVYYFNGNTLDSRTFKLKGNDVILINIGDKWVDPGYIYQDEDKDLSSEVEVTGEVNLNSIGEYKIDYKVSVGLVSNTLTRTIKVVDSKVNTGFRLFLKGSSTYYLINGNEYNDPGYEAYDTNDGNISGKITRTGSVDSHTNGTYSLTYTVTNSNNVTKTITRQVIVYSFNLKGSIKYTSFVKENEINLTIDENIYNYTVLPDGTKTTERNINYKVYSNGSYTFIVYDKNGGTFKYEANIMNIDLVKPTGTCELQLLDKGGKITVNASDDNKLKGYIYQYGNNKSELIDSNTLSINTTDNKVSVTIYDEADNYETISCKVVDKSKQISRSYKSHVFTTSGGKKYEYWFYTPKHSKREKLPLLIYFHGDGGRKSMKDVNLYAYPSFISKGMDFPFYMVAPHVDSTDDFGTDARMEKTYELIKYIMANYDIDTTRIIVSGGSSGARGAYRMASKYKTLFSCMVIGSGITYQLYEKDLTHLPIWFFHGEKDGAINYQDMERHVKKINELGGNARITIVRGGGHDITETVLKRDDLIQWMVKQRRK